MLRDALLFWQRSHIKVKIMNGNEISIQVHNLNQFWISFIFFSKNVPLRWKNWMPFSLRHFLVLSSLSLFVNQVWSLLLIERPSFRAGKFYSLYFDFLLFFFFFFLLNLSIWVEEICNKRHFFAHSPMKNVFCRWIHMMCALWSLNPQAEITQNKCSHLI